MDSAQNALFEFKNDFLYVLIRQEPALGSGAFLYRCGINLSRFCPLSWRKGGICSNPTVRGIQLLRSHVAAYAARQRMTAERAENVALTSPDTPHGEGWYHEHPLVIGQGSADLIRKLLAFSVMDLVKTVLVVCVPHAKIPDSFADAAAMQKFLESLAIAEERDRTIAWEKQTSA